MADATSNMSSATSAAPPAASGAAGGAAAITATAGTKRPRSEDVRPELRLCTPVAFTAAKPRPRMSLLPLKPKTATTRSASASEQSAAAIPVVRPPLLQHLDEYLSLVGNMYYQTPETGKSTEQFALVRRTTLGVLTSALREPGVLDKWSPYDIALFESSICLVGKNFPQIAAVIKTKTANDVIEFYYVWKKSKNYEAWKRTYKHSFEVPE